MKGEYAAYAETLSVLTEIRSYLSLHRLIAYAAKTTKEDVMNLGYTNGENNWY